MWEALHMPVVQDEQILFSAVVTAEAIQLVLLLSSGTATNMMDWRHCGRLISAFNIIKKSWHDVLKPRNKWM